MRNACGQPSIDGLTVDELGQDDGDGVSARTAHATGTRLTAKAATRDFAVRLMISGRVVGASERPNLAPLSVNG